MTDAPPLLSYARARWVLVATLVAVFAPLLFRGHVAFPHDNRPEVGLPEEEVEGRRSNRAFTDHSHAFLPELHEQLNGDSAGWISTWTPHVEMGRPTAHVSGFSRAYLPTNVLAWFCDDALVAYTVLVLLAILLTGLFGLALFEELGLEPSAGLLGALGLATGQFAVSRISFAMFVWGVCWSVAILWLVTAFLRRPRATYGLGLAFSIHALFLTAYPQQIVWLAYMIAGYVLVRVARADGDLRARLGGLGRMTPWVVLGLASLAPVYLDLMLNAARSARLDTPDDFFTQVLPELGGWRDALLFWSQTLDPTWVSDDFATGRQAAKAARTGAMNLTPAVALLLVLSASSWRRLWPAQAFVIACVVLSLWHAPYLFGVHHAGLGLSRFVPLFAMHVPVMVIAAYAADRVLREHGRPVVSTVVVALLVALAWGGFAAAGVPIEPANLALGGSLVALLVAFLFTRRAVLLVVLAVATSLGYAPPLLFTRPPDEIRLKSTLVKRVQEETADGTRFAWIDKGVHAALPPNQEALHELRSPHSYNSLSAEAFQSWVGRVSGAETKVFGRRFGTFASGPDLDEQQLALAGVGLLLSPRRLPPTAGKYIDSVRGVSLTEPRQLPVLEAQVLEFELGSGGTGGTASFAVDAPRRGATRIEQRDDRLRFELQPATEPTLLFASQQHHPQWIARVDGEPAETVVVDGFYQGVLVPPGGTTVELEFRPLVRWSWVPQVVFVLLALAIAALRLRAAPRVAPHADGA